VGYQLGRFVIVWAAGFGYMTTVAVGYFASSRSASAARKLFAPNLPLSTSTIFLPSRGKLRVQDLETSHCLVSCFQFSPDVCHRCLPPFEMRGEQNQVAARVTLGVSPQHCYKLIAHAEHEGIIRSLC